MLLPPYGVLRQVRYWHAVSYIDVDTKIAYGYGGIGLRGCYAMSGTEIGYGAWGQMRRHPF
eukprot:3940756-Rhodomonas_salina.3